MKRTRKHIRLKKLNLILYSTLISFLILFINCADIDIEGLDSFENEIIAFIFQEAENSGNLYFDMIGTINDDSIDISVPYGTNMNLVPTIIFTGKSLSPESGQSQTFQNGVGIPYVVYAEDNTEKKYDVIVRVETSDAKDITAIGFLQANNPGLSSNVEGTISGTAITFFLPAGTDTSSLVPTVSATGVALSPANNTPNSFPDGTGILYTVSASDASTKDYTITVYIPPLSGNSGTIDLSGATPHTIDLDWTQASDNSCTQAELTYMVYYSTSNNITTVTDAETNGTPFGTYTAEMDNITVTGLNDATTYYFNVIVKDPTDNKAVYTTNSYTLPSAIPPAQVIVTSVAEGNGEITIDWTDPVDPDFDHIEISWTPAGTGIQNIAPGTQTYTAGSLTNGTEYTISIVSVDDVDNKSDAVIIKATPNISGPVINYCIYTADDLNAVRGGGLKVDWDKTKSYILMADVDLSGYSPWTPLGISDVDTFSGNFNGNGHEITGLYINTTSENQGLFGNVFGESVIKNIRLIGCDVAGGKNTGGLIGYFKKNSNLAGVFNCFVSGNIATTVPSNSAYTGGLVGWLYSDGGSAASVERCGVNVTISVPSPVVAYSYIGGLVGYHGSSWNINYCYSSGNFVDVDRSVYIGGLVGKSEDNIENCYTRIDVIGQMTVGGLVGLSDGSILNSYATSDVTQGFISNTNFGGFCGGGTVVPLDSYYCGTLIGTTITDNAMATRKTIPEMQLESTYTGWDFAGIWDIDPVINNGYPYLIENIPE